VAQLLGIPLGSFRFRGRAKALSAICAALRAEPGKGLHAVQIARATGLSMPLVNEILSQTPELFVRLPKRDGVTRYRLTTSTAGLTPGQVEDRILRAVRTETRTLYALMSIVLAAVALAMAMSLPLFALSSG
jgi:hypothetical protein